MESNYYAYVLVNPHSGKIFYVGKGKYDRLYKHERAILQGRKTHNNYLDNTIRLIHKTGGRVIHRKIIDNVDEPTAFEMEKSLIEQIGMDNLCNFTPGGDGASPNKEVRKKISENRKGIPVSEATRKLMSLQRTGKKASEKTKEKMSAVKIGKPQTPAQREANKIRSEKMRGRKFSDEHRKKLSESNLQNPRRAWLGKTIPQEMRDRISRTLKERNRRGSDGQVSE